MDMNLKFDSSCRIAAIKENLIFFTKVQPLIQELECAECLNLTTYAFSFPFRIKYNIIGCATSRHAGKALHTH
jgi:hypothetical protein